MSGSLLVLWLSLAAYRLTRIVTLDGFTEPWREAIFDRWPPDTERTRWRYVKQHRALVQRAPTDRPSVHWIGQLIECPWCIGTYISGGVVLIAATLGSVPLPFLTWAAVGCLVGLIGETDLALTK